MSEKNTKDVILPESGFVRADIVRRVLGISKGALYQAVNSGYFPEPIRITAKTVAWDVKEIRAFIERRKVEAMAQRKKRMDKMQITEQFYESENETSGLAPRP